MTRLEIRKRCRHLTKRINEKLEKEYKPDDYDVFWLGIFLIGVAKIIDEELDSTNTLITNEIVKNVHRNYFLLGELAEYTLPPLTKKQITNILFNPSARKSLYKQLKINKNFLKRGIINEIKSNILMNKPITDIEVKIGNMIYKSIYGKTKGDAAKLLRTFRTEYTRTRTLAKLTAAEELKKEGFDIHRSWVYTYEAMKPRPAHVEAYGQIDVNGYFIIDGYRTRGPGLFGRADQDINCRCDTDIIIGPKL